MNASQDSKLTVLSDGKPVDDVGSPATIRNHSSAEILMTNYPGQHLSEIYS